jgi:ADP-ribosylglycohydrolase
VTGTPTDAVKKTFFRGCLLGGGVGDALGAPVEFMSLDEIRGRYGPTGIQGYESAYGRKGAWTDDTQMTLFTAEGLLIARTRPGVDPVESVYHAYLRWLLTQRTDAESKLLTAYGTCALVDGILSGIPEMHARRAPGNTCLQALESGTMGTMEKPVNQSKGCGGVMRVAPVGLFMTGEAAFDGACQMAAITHGHPTGYLAAGCLAQMISDLLRKSCGVEPAAQNALRTLEKHSGHEECTVAIKRALASAAGRSAGPAVIEALGQGWVAEEALAIAVYCAITARENMAQGLLLAANHGGDSDSTASITGSLMGCMLGEDAIPQEFLEILEMRELIEEIADDIFERSDPVQ